MCEETSPDLYQKLHNDKQVIFVLITFISSTIPFYQPTTRSWLRRCFIGYNTNVPLMEITQAADFFMQQERPVRGLRSRLCLRIEATLV